MVARFRQTTQRPAVDRQAMLRRALQAAQSRRQSAAPTRGGSPIADRVGGMRGAQGAVDFGAAMTGQNTGLQQAMDAIRSRVGQGLASKGIYQDQSGYHIQGLPQPPDTGIAMRDAAVRAMGGDPWTKIVQEADARLRAGNLPIPRTAGVNGPVPQPGLGGVPAPGRVGLPASTSAGRLPVPSGQVPQPGLGGVPQVAGGTTRSGSPPPINDGPPVGSPLWNRMHMPGSNALNGVPQPGLGGVPQVPSRPSNVTPFPPQGQGVGRTTTPTGNQVSPGQYPTTAPQPGLGGTFGIPPGGAPTPITQSSINANDRIGISAPTQQSINNGAFRPYQQPTSPVGTAGPQGIDPNASQQGRIGMGTGGQIIGSGLTTPPRPTSATVTTPGRVNPQTGVPSPGLGGVPQVAGRPATPTVAPGSVPGQSTPSRPGQMPATFPNGKPFGTSGSPFGADFPFGNRPAPGAAGVPGMPNGAQMAQDIISRVQGVRAQSPLAGQQDTGMASLAGLGDRISASVQRAVSGTSGVPGVGTSDLGGSLGASTIMGRVRSQLQAGGLGQGAPTGQPTGQPTTAVGTTPGGAPTGTAPAGSAPIVAGPASGTSPAVSGGTVPQGTIQTQQWGNGVSWSNLGQYDATIQAEAAKYGIDPAYIYASMAIESGGADVCNPNGVNCHVLQMWPGNAQDAARLGYDINTNEGQIGYFAAIAAGQAGIGTGNTPEERIMSVYPGAGGSAQHVAEYDRDWNAIVDQYHTGSQPQAASVGPPTTGTQVLPTNAPQQIDPTTGAPIQATPVTGAGRAGGITPATTGVDQSTGTESGAPLPTTGSERYPIVSGTLSPTATPLSAPTGYAQGAPVPQGDGIGIYAGPNADESWMQTMSPDAYVSTEYKQDVCQTYDSRCCCNGQTCGNGCPYDSNVIPQMSGASTSVHPGYDVGMAPGTEFSTPMSGTVIGNNSTARDANGGCTATCTSPAGTCECDWAYDNGVVMDGGTDMNGQPIYINYDHVTGGDYSGQYVGQEIPAGTPLGVVGDAAHIHVEVHGYCEQTGKMVVLDPSLVYGGYYETHSACEGVV